MTSSCFQLLMFQRCSMSLIEQSGIFCKTANCRPFELVDVSALKSNLFATLFKTDKRTMVNVQGWRCVIRKENAYV